MIRHQVGRAVALAALAALALGSSAAAGDAPLRRSHDESLRLWLVELSGPAEDFRRRARDAGIDVRERRSFTTLWNGVSVEVAPGDVAAVRELDGVTAVYPNVVASVPRPDTSVDDSATAAARRHRGPDEIDGSGVTVGLIDTGLDWQHPDLGGCFGHGCRLRRGWDFVGDAYDPNPASPTFDPTAVPDPDPDDCNGHGTHVAGIVGASGRVQGVAPAVDLVAYRVTGCAGQVAADVMLAALERAHRDRVDALNISIGTAFLGWPDYPTAKAASRLVERGIVVVAAIGNSGPAPTYAAAAPAVGENVIGVASFDSRRSELAAFRISPDGRQVLFTPATGAPPAPLTGTHPLSFQGPGCTPLAPGTLAGQIAVVVRGVCALHNKAFVAQAAGAVGVVLVNNVPGRFTPIVTGPAPVTIPFVGITLADGTQIVERLASGPVSLTWTDETGTEAVPTGGAISALSSWGLAADLSLKPDLGAPGGFVWSTYPLEKGRYSNISGTSMASAYVAGAAALLLDAKPRTRAEDVRTILQNTADPANVLGTTTIVDAVHRQGAGMVDVEGALAADTAVTPARLSLGEGSGDTVRITIANEGDRRRTYTLSHVPALATSNNTPAYTFAAFADRQATVTFSETSVSIGPGQRERVGVSIAPHATLPDLSTYGGYVVVDDGEGASFSVPYAGLKGDLQSIPIFTGHRLLVRQTAAGFEPVTDGAVFRLTGVTETPTVLVHLDQHARVLEAKLLRARDGAEVHRSSWSAFEVEYVPKSGAPAAFLTIPWDGTHERTRGRRTRTKPVPDGSYRLLVRALRPLGDRSNPAHWDSFTTPTFTIDRP